jgi:hypothetical protein
VWAAGAVAALGLWFPQVFSGWPDMEGLVGPIARSGWQNQAGMAELKISARRRIESESRFSLNEDLIRTEGFASVVEAINAQLDMHLSMTVENFAVPSILPHALYDRSNPDDGGTLQHELAAVGRQVSKIEKCFGPDHPVRRVFSRPCLEEIQAKGDRRAEGGRLPSVYERDTESQIHESVRLNNNSNAAPVAYHQVRSQLSFGGLACDLVRLACFPCGPASGPQGQADQNDFRNAPPVQAVSNLGGVLRGLRGDPLGGKIVGVVFAVLASASVFLFAGGGFGVLFGLLKKGRSSRENLKLLLIGSVCLIGGFAGLCVVTAI